MPKPFIDRPEIRLAMFGCMPGNAHLYSWSAIFNGYDRERMTRECPVPTTVDYLKRGPADEFPNPGARVTHICCTGENVFNAEQVAACSLIPNVVERPEDVIGEVDVDIVATDIGAEHVERCRPFVEAGLPLFVDKPMVDNAADLAVFDHWIAGGHRHAAVPSQAVQFPPGRQDAVQRRGDRGFGQKWPPRDQLSAERRGLPKIDG